MSRRRMMDENFYSCRRSIRRERPGVKGKTPVGEKQQENAEAEVGAVKRVGGDARRRCPGQASGSSAASMFCVFFLQNRRSVVTGLNIGHDLPREHERMWLILKTCIWGLTMRATIKWGSLSGSRHGKPQCAHLGNRRGQ